MIMERERKVIANLYLAIKQSESAGCDATDLRVKLAHLEADLIPYRNAILQEGSLQSHFNIANRIS